MLGEQESIDFEDDKKERRRRRMFTEVVRERERERWLVRVEVESEVRKPEKISEERED